MITSLRMHTDTITNCTLLGSFDCDSFYKWIPLKPNRWLVAISFEVDIPYHLWNTYIYIFFICAFIIMHLFTILSSYSICLFILIPLSFWSQMSLRWIRVVLLFFHQHLKAFTGLLHPRQGNLNFICNNLDFRSLISRWTSMLLNPHSEAL